MMSCSRKHKLRPFNVTKVTTDGKRETKRLKRGELVEAGQNSSFSTHLDEHLDDEQDCPNDDDSSERAVDDNWPSQYDQSA